MASIITITHQPIRLSVATGTAQRQAIYLATDVGSYDCLDLDCTVAAVEGTSPSLKINIVTGMQTQTEDGWVVAGAFNGGSAFTASDTSSLLTIGNNSAAGVTLLRYIRWDVTAFSGTSAFATFWIRGVARKFS